jgi:putative Holliday junction resolvase
MRTGVRIGIDVGTVRVGVARSDPAGVLATPLVTLARSADNSPELTAELAEIVRLVEECDALEVIIGLPRSLSGREGTAAASVRSYAEAVARRVTPVPVRLVDERLTTVTATRSLREAGVKGRRHRPVVDQAAAVVILQSALDGERVSGRAPGALVDLGSAPESPVSQALSREAVAGERADLVRRRAEPGPR